MIRSVKPSVVLLDVNLPGMNGQQITHQVMQERVPTRIILMTGYDDIEQALHTAMAGAAAYFAKDVEPKALLRIIRDVAEGKYVFGGRVMNERELQTWIEQHVEGTRQSYSEPGSPFHPLSEREMQVLECVVEGMSNKEIRGPAGHQSPDRQEPCDCDPAEVRRGRPHPGGRVCFEARLGAIAEVQP